MPVKFNPPFIPEPLSTLITYKLEDGLWIDASLVHIPIGVVINPVTDTNIPQLISKHASDISGRDPKHASIIPGMEAEYLAPLSSVGDSDMPVKRRGAPRTDKYADLYHLKDGTKEGEKRFYNACNSRRKQLKMDGAVAVKADPLYARTVVLPEERHLDLPQPEHDDTLGLAMLRNIQELYAEQHARGTEIKRWVKDFAQRQATAETDYLEHLKQIGN